MAKRTSRSKADDTNNAAPPAPAPEAPKARRGRASSTQPPKDASSDTTRSDSMGSEPSEEAIRLRAYQRYLERGGGHGMEFEDWLHAERELKTRR
jgi:hypothetical protein